MKYYLEEKEKVLEELKTNENGLTTEEAEKRLGEIGKNKLAEGKKTSVIVRFLKELIDPMILVLIGAAIVSGITSFYSNEFPTDVIIILAVVIINAILGVVQESKAEKAIEALQEMSAATSKVLRNGTLHIIKSEDIVPGDVVLLEAGDAVPADGRIIEAASLKIEEAALTGESVPVNKLIESLELGEHNDIPLGDRKNMVYMGSTVVYGRAKVVITDTAMKTEMGKIADALTKAVDGDTPLQKKLGELSKILTYIVLGICVVIFGVILLRDGLTTGITKYIILDTFMVAVSLAVAAIPEGLATVVTIVLSIGVTNMSKRNAIIRKLTAVETLGCAQIICSDKTGTLTQNKMTVTEEFTESKDLLAMAMALCSDAEVGENGEAEGEPTECALVNYALKCGYNKTELKKEQPRVAEAPFDSNRKMMSTIHSTSEGIIQYTKGAPDELLRRCKKYIKDGKVTFLTDEAKAEILAENKRMADKALRVLCAAYRQYENVPESLASDEIEKNLTFIGLTGMIDPIRPEVKVAIDECKSAGIRPIMITGDHKDTAVAIAKELGIIQSADEAITGMELNAIPEADFDNLVEKYSVYARVQPEHKVRIVNAWKKKGYITAMTGDGVNDAPSIKSADIGVGMGITGTDVTKNVADMVLSDDNFATIVGAVEEGRRIYDNIRKAIQFLLGSNLSEVLSILIASLMGFTLLKPVHLLWINLITDTFPALSLGTESAEENIMSRKPRNKNEGIFAQGMGKDIIYQGVVVTILTLISYFLGVLINTGSFQFVNISDKNGITGMTMAFVTLALAENFHSLNMRSLRGSIFSMKTSNKYLTASTISGIIITTLVVMVKPIANIFGFTALSVMEFASAALLAVMIIPIVEFVKIIETNKNK